MRPRGREKDGLTQTTRELPTAGAIPDSGNPALRRYTQSYQYDAVGNLLEMKHQLGSGGTVLWRRGYAYAAGSNRLLSSSLPGDDPDDPNDHSALYSYDARGALSNLPHLQGFTRDFRDQLRKVVLDLAGNEAWYAHDGAGQRVRKLVDRGAVTEERIYVGGWEVWRKRVNGTLDEERTTLHVRDGERRVAMVDTKTVAGGQAVGSPVARWRFQLDDHLGSAVSECDEEGGVFSYEELHPYGSVAWSAVDSALDVSPRRYRYTGMERDEETGLQAHGVRMYAPWLGRWDRPDPIGLGDGVNRWGYVHGGVTRAADRTGRLAGVDDAAAAGAAVAAKATAGTAVGTTATASGAGGASGVLSATGAGGAAGTALAVTAVVAAFVSAGLLGVGIAEAIEAVKGDAWQASMEDWVFWKHATGQEMGTSWRGVAEWAWGELPSEWEGVGQRVVAQSGESDDSLLDRYSRLSGRPASEMSEAERAELYSAEGELATRGLLPGQRSLASKGVGALDDATTATLRGLDDVPWGQYCRSGCENVALSIQKAIGGEVHRIKPSASLPGSPTLGPRSGQATGWFHHEAVVKDGRVFDAMTGPEGLPIDDYKAAWEYSDVIDFGF